MAIRKWTVLGSTRAFDGRWYKLRRDVVRLPNGQQVDDYFVSERPDIAITFALTASDEVVLVRQYKHGVQDVTLELPAGSFLTEEARDAAARELAEESGYRSTDWTALGWAYEDPTRNTNRIHMFLATGCRPGPQDLQDLEIAAGIEVVLLPKDEVLAAIRDNRIRAISSIVTIHRALDGLGGTR